MDKIIIEYANQHFREIIAPLCYSKGSLGGMYEEGDRATSIIGHWHEEGSHFEITCPAQLRDSLIELLNNAHLLKLIEE